jgi:signal peptidase
MQFSAQKSSLKKLVKNHGRKLLNVLVLFAVIAIGFLGFWFASKAMLNTEYPMLPVSANNMCISQSNCDSLTHPFEPTLHVGDLVIIQGANAKDIRSAYPNSDILVFHSPKSDSYDSDVLITTRVVAEEEKNGTVYFRTKGDGVGVHMWPETPSLLECDPWHDYRENYTWNGMVSEKLLVGKVVFRVPWIGYIALFVQNPSGMLVVIMIIIVIIVIVELAVPKFTGKKAETKPKKSAKKALET